MGGGGTVGYFHCFDIYINIFVFVIITYISSELNATYSQRLVYHRFLQKTNAITG